MFKKLIVILTVMAFVTLMFAAVQAEEAAKAEDHAFVGAKKCKPCHKKDTTYPTWEATAHATALDSLSADEKKDPVCLGCHSTGINAKGVLLEGVQCEACHGAGADYKKKKIMQDHEAAMAAGLNMIDEKTCLKCHDAKAAPEGHAEMAKFDFAKAKTTGLHGMPEKAAK